MAKLKDNQQQHLRRETTLGFCQVVYITSLNLTNARDKVWWWSKYLDTNTAWTYHVADIKPETPLNTHFPGHWDFWGLWTDMIGQGPETVPKPLGYIQSSTHGFGRVFVPLVTKTKLITRWAAVYFLHIFQREVLQVMCVLMKIYNGG